MDTDINARAKRVRRFHSDEKKAGIVAQCAVPGASLAAIARSHGINASIVRGWCKSRLSATAKPVHGFVALPMPADAPPTIHIEVQRGSTKVLLTWPASAAGECASLLREVLR